MVTTESMYVGDDVRVILGCCVGFGVAIGVFCTPAFVGNGVGVRVSAGLQRTSGLLSLLFVASRRGVERSGMRSPEISQMIYPFRFRSIAYSVFSHMARSSS